MFVLIFFYKSKTKYFLTIFVAETWQVLSSDNGSMTRSLFEEWVEYFCDRMEEAGYGKKNGPGHNCEVLLDGHNSRWTFRGLLMLIKRGFFPFCYASHTSAWWAPNDDGVNGMCKAITGRTIHDWRVINVFGIFDKPAYNRCLVKAVQIMKQRLAANLAAWQAKKKAWEECCRTQDEVEPLTGKPGNVITRAWARCGWHPLKRESDNWKKVLPTLGQRYATKAAGTSQPKMLAHSNKQIAIRDLAWQGFNDNFLAMAKEVSEAHERRRARRHLSIVDTRTGAGFTCADDIQFLREAEERKKKDEEVCYFLFFPVTLTLAPQTHTGQTKTCGGKCAEERRGARQGARGFGRGSQYPWRASQRCCQGE